MKQTLWIHHMVSWTSVLHLRCLQMASEYSKKRIINRRAEDTITHMLNIFHDKKLTGKLWMYLSILKIIRCSPNHRNSCFEEHETNEDTVRPDSQYRHAPVCLPGIECQYLSCFSSIRVGSDGVDCVTAHTSVILRPSSSSFSCAPSKPLPQQLQRRMKHAASANLTYHQGVFVRRLHPKALKP